VDSQKEKGMAYSVELSRRIYDDACGACIEVGPDGDGLGCVGVCTPDAASKEHFGNIRFTVSPELARLLGKALIDAAADAGA
jgi:hypothetical protein